jgi:copper transport protein
MVAALGCLVTFASTAGGRRAVWVAAAIASVGLAFSITTTGHAAGAPPRMVMHTAHVLGAGMWLGTLAMLMAIRGGFEPSERAGLFRAFSAVAFGGAAVLAVSGLAATYLYVASPSALWTTGYGRTLLAKIALVLGAASCGYLNWRSINGGRDEPGRPVTVELLLAVSIVAATGLLTELEHP